MTAPQPDRPCARCERTRPHHGRGMCEPCYRQERAKRNLSAYPATNRTHDTAVLELLGTGLTHREIGERVGLSANAVEMRLRKLRARKDKPAMDAYTGTTWQHLHVPPPPDTPACAGYAPDVFTEWELPLIRNGVPARWTGPQLDVAFSMCAVCPVRDWCVATAVLPHRTAATIVAGGVLWHEGRKRWDMQRHAAWRQHQAATESVA